MSREDDELEAWRARAALNDAARIREVVHVTEALADEDDYGPARTVACRQCGRSVEMSGFGWWCAKRSSELLMRQGEPPLDQDTIMLCPGCRGIADARASADFAAVYAKQVPLIKGAKERGYLTHEETRWLIANGMKDTVDALEERFKRQANKRGPTRPADMEEP